MRMYRCSWVLAIATLVAGCATAKPSGVGGGDPDAHEAGIDANMLGGRPDAAPMVDAPPGTPDAPPPPPDAKPAPDAMPGTITMTESTSSTIVQGNTVSCNDGPPYFDTAENSYYRAFKLSDFGVNSALAIQHVDFGVEQAIAGGASQSVTVKVYTYTGATGTALDTSMMTPIGSKTVKVPDTSNGEMVTAAVSATAPAGSTIVVEIFIPDGTQALNTLFLGSNTAGESQPGYIRAPTCSTATPTAFASLASAPVVDLVMSVTGTYN